MRSVLQHLVRAESGFSLSLRKGRCGWLFRTSLPERLVRQRLGRWCSRLSVVHAPSGKFFAQPSCHYFRRALAGAWPFACLTPVQRERLRRLRPFLERPTAVTSPVDGQIFLRIALRFDALAERSDSKALCRHLSDDLDLLWRNVPLYRVRLTPFQKLILSRLAVCSS